MSNSAEQQAPAHPRPNRARSLLRGVVYFNNRRSSYDCLVRDISPSGARLSFSDAVVLPDVFDLHIPNKDHTYRARVMWRHSEEAGVAFEIPGHDDTTPQPQSQDLAARVAHLETEVAALKRVLRTLKSEIEPDSGAV